MTIPERYKALIDYFLAVDAPAETELQYTNPFQLLVAVILSAQCTDKRVNEITPDLFRRFPDAQTLSRADVEEVFEYIRTCSYPNNKAKHLVGMAKMLVNEYNNIIPSDIDEMQNLPGVGRKTANVIASVIYDKPAMAVDTHVFRVAARIGLTQNAKTPLDAEKQLVRNFPEHLLGKAHHWLILHGRYICTARNPKCSTCKLSHLCAEYANQML